MSRNHPVRSRRFSVYSVRLSPLTLRDLRSHARIYGVTSCELARVLIEAGLGQSFSDSEIRRLGLDS